MDDMVSFCVGIHYRADKYSPKTTSRNMKREVQIN